MAIVKLADESEELEDDRTSYQVYIEDYGRYTGPPGTRWQLLGPSSYQFWTPADKVADAVEAVRAGKTGVKAALAACPEMQEVFDRYLENCDDGEPPQSRAERLKEFIEILDIDELFTSLLGDNPYWVEDAFNELAAEALEYPPWARAEADIDGGMGTSYSAGVIVIDKGHDLPELWRWLEQRQGEVAAGQASGRPGKKVTKRAPRK